MKSVPHSSLSGGSTADGTLRRMGASVATSGAATGGNSMIDLPTTTRGRPYAAGISRKERGKPRSAFPLIGAFTLPGGG